MQHLDLLLQHLDETLATYVRNRWNIWKLHLKHTYIVIATRATFRSTFATHLWNIWNISLQHAFSSAISPCCLDEWKFIVAELDASAKVGNHAWSSLVPQRRQRHQCPAWGATSEHSGMLSEHPLQHPWRAANGRRAPPAWRAWAPPAASVAARPPWLASTRVRDREESHRLHDGETEDRESQDGNRADSDRVESSRTRTWNPNSKPETAPNTVSGDNLNPKPNPVDTRNPND
jgi:hypothetical protein